MAVVLGSLSATAGAQAQDRGITCADVPGGSSAQLTCAGELMDAKVVGAGQIHRFDGGDSCLGDGRGRFRAVMPVLTVLGRRTLEIEASYSFTRIGLTRIATGTAVATLTTRGIFAPEGTVEETRERSYRFSSVAAGGGACPSSAAAGGSGEHMGFGAGADLPESGGPAPLVEGLLDGACANHRRGSGASDDIVGTLAGDRIAGLGGGDRIRGMGGHDCLRGDGGADELAGGSGHDGLRGGAGNDHLVGGAGNDHLVGGAGRDRFSGGPGRDLIDALDGRAERVSCGGGRDVVRGDRGDTLSGCERRLRGR